MTAVTETQQRFLRAVLERVPLARVAELHLFAPMRQGGQESGIAVLAAWPEGYAAPDALAPAIPAPGSPAPDAPAADAAANEADVVAAAPDATEVAPDAAPDVAPPDDAPLPPADVATATAADVAAPDVTAPDVMALDVTVPDDDVSSQAVATAGDVGERTPSTAPVDDFLVDGAVQAAGAAALEDAAPVEPDESPRPGEDATLPAAPISGPSSPSVRHVVYTARYRLTLKGPDRGRWDVDVREEADAPLVTVDAVVRGVQRRAGDTAEVERLDPATLATAVSETPWRPTA